ncbi:hypothetical protein VIGAN_04108700 [Vigna angularis var. angularis]|uniref:Late embryogenesis abundant protein LEA-2 subgroup domain-containing protein n=1 Tax=Vigna angularis var. angularis TaxID=157739 RepID=A0A0S3RTF4_PHAAN|nr:uncharacterized protein LOC108327921 [Vigna angularis]XP_052729782.1 uncharacterized protein LOC108327921 [Vigna angularis]XP_052729783.1 uncharacterized protein LOC108327921 [Vigna angularis]BAT83851.1 hypothetical protein VIGAN_04108700 [Vigna angularis var. angularis]
MKAGSGKGRKVCLIVTGVVIALVLVIVILALTVFKAKHPTTVVDSTKLEDFHMSLDIARLRVDLNVTLSTDVSVKNPNKVGFKYSDSTAHLNYRGQLIGEVPIPAGEISSGETKGFNLTLTIMADRLLSNSQLFSDVTSVHFPTEREVKMMGDRNISDPKPVDGALSLAVVRLASGEPPSQSIAHFCDKTTTILYWVHWLHNRLNVNSSEKEKWLQGMGVILCTDNVNDLYIGRITLQDIGFPYCVDMD